MSDEKVQSSPPLEEPQCYSEALECIDHPEDHYAEIDGVGYCSPEVVVVKDYEVSEAGVREIVKVDEQKALAVRSRSFEDKPESEKLARESQPNETSVANLEQQAHPLPHSHGEGEMVAGAAMPIPTVPFDLSTLICYHCLWDGGPVTYENGSTPEVAPKNVQVLGFLEPEPEPKDVVRASLLGLGILFQDPSFREWVIEQIFSKESFYDHLDFAVVGLIHLPTAVPPAIELPNRETSDGQAALIPARFDQTVPLPLTDAYSRRYYFSDGSEPVQVFNPHFASLSDQGALLVFPGNREVFFESIQTVAVLPPSLVSLKEGSMATRTRELLDLKTPLHRVARGSASQSGQDSSHRQSGEEQRGRDSRHSFS